MNLDTRAKGTRVPASLLEIDAVTLVYGNRLIAPFAPKVYVLDLILKQRTVRRRGERGGSRLRRVRKRELVRSQNVEMRSYEKLRPSHNRGRILRDFVVTMISA
ncbi:hypothetical protein AB1N83_012107 [Pleurotus pulmonarius]